MSALRTAVCAIVLGLFACGPATAASLKNGDKVDYKLSIAMGEKSEDLTIKAGDRLQVCSKSCVITMQGKPPFKVDSPDVVWIQQGSLVKSLD